MWRRWQLPEPMSSWFRPVPSFQEQLAFASNMQQETVSKLLRYYRARHVRYKSLVVQMKSQSNEDKRSARVSFHSSVVPEPRRLLRRIDQLQTEIKRLSKESQFQENPDVNGKRRRMEERRAYGFPGALSSSRPADVMSRSSSVASNPIIEPPPPERLTFPMESARHPPISNTLRALSSEAAHVQMTPRQTPRQSHTQNDHSGRRSSPLDLTYVTLPIYC